MLLLIAACALVATLLLVTAFRTPAPVRRAPAPLRTFTYTVTPTRFDGWL